MIQPFRFTFFLRFAYVRECAERIFERRTYVYARLLELRIRALCSSSGKTSVGRQWEELSNADICSNVPRAVTERRGGYCRVPFKVPAHATFTPSKNREVCLKLSQKIVFYSSALSVFSQTRLRDL